MLTVELIQKLINETASVLKNTKKDKPWKFTPIYHKTVELAEDIAIHADSDEFPTRLFREKAPNEDPDLFRWRKNNYRPITRPYWQRAENITGRIWNAQNYSVVFESMEEESVSEDESVEKYFLEEYPNYGSIINYFSQIVSKYKLRDANACITICPKYLPTKITQDANGDEIEVYDTTQRIAPVCMLHTAKDTIRFDEGIYCLVMLPDKSEVEVGNKIVKEGFVFELYDDVNIYRIYQVGKKNQYEFEYEIYFPHNLGYVPAWLMKGIPEQIETYTIYKSPYYSAVPVLDTALFDESTLQAAKVTGAFPVWWEIVDNCRATGCVDGFINDQSVNDDGEVIIDRKTCQVCNGTGKRQRRNVFATYEVEPANSAMGIEQAPTPPLGYVALNPEILEFLRKEVDINCNKFLDMLNIDSSKDKAQPETATGKALDREELFSFLLQFSSEVFFLLNKAIDAIGRIRYGDVFIEPTIKAPASFSIRSESDLIDELKEANDSHLPRQYKQMINREAIGVRFPNDEEQSEIRDLIAFADTLDGYSPDEIAVKMGGGQIPKWKVVLHDSILSYIEEKDYSDDKAWEEADKIGKRDILVSMAKIEAEAQTNSPLTAEKIIV